MSEPPVPQPNKLSAAFSAESRKQTLRSALFAAHSSLSLAAQMLSLAESCVDDPREIEEIRTRADCVGSIMALVRIKLEKC